MKKQIKVLTTIIMIIAVIATLGNLVLAFDAGSTIDSINGATNVDASGFTNLGGKIVRVLQIVGVVVAVVVLLVIGIKYMVGSAEEKAEYKKVMIPYLIGALLVAAGTTIVRVVFDMFAGIEV